MIASFEFHEILMIYFLTNVDHIFKKVSINDDQKIIQSWSFTSFRFLSKIFDILRKNPEPFLLK
ncbi:hypothetical protein BpHYR1_044109 [Brachionus plicatilis]|uniref:Uncharacterized protein n=1 Tax=Brachionus plicatilis TaxID=10195 RepID=A0A3M7Q8Q3_BRAPC|nr:hypothetical protein BpHYR1_044109 [Brachionus plicatilis]